MFNYSYYLNIANIKGIVNYAINDIYSLKNLIEIIKYAKKKIKNIELLSFLNLLENKIISSIQKFIGLLSKKQKLHYTTPIIYKLQKLLN
jgi:hypothetical protein